jgi:hypothetical protein
MAFIVPVIAAVAEGVAAIGTAAAGAASTAATVAGVGGAVLSGIGAYQQNKAAQQSAEFNAKQEEQAAIADRDAADAEAQDRRRRGSAARATALAERGASGIALAGTPLLVDEDIIGEIELDAARVKHRGEVSAIRRQNQASLDRSTARGYSRAAGISAGASLLGGISRTY